MLLTSQRYIAMELAVTLIRALRKDLLQPDEPLVDACIEQIHDYYRQNFYDTELMEEILDILKYLGVKNLFEI